MHTNAIGGFARNSTGSCASGPGCAVNENREVANPGGMDFRKRIRKVIEIARSASVQRRSHVSDSELGCRGDFGLLFFMPARLNFVEIDDNPNLMLCK